MPFSGGQYGPDAQIDTLGNALSGAVVTVPDGYTSLLDALGNLTITGPATDALTYTITPVGGTPIARTVRVEPLVSELSSQIGSAGDSSLLMTKAANLTDVASAPAARTALGLGTAAVVDIGTGPGNAILGSDSRLTNNRTPVAHASSHAAGGGDFINPSEQVNTVAASGSAQTLPDVTTATLHRVTLTANCTFTFPTAAAGKSFTVVLVQDGTGSRTVTWPGSVLWAGGTAPTLTTTASKRDVFTFMCADGTNYLGFTAGLNF